jgi:hypothetical protein
VRDSKLTLRYAVAPDSEDYYFDAVGWRDQFRHNRPDSVEEDPHRLRYKLGLTAVSRRLSELIIIFLQLSPTHHSNMSINGVNSHANGNVLPALALSADEFLKHDYDFMIIGGGTAGLAVAARLSENPDVTVGVLEAGKNKLDDFLVDTPGTFLHLLGAYEYLQSTKFSRC